MQYYMLWHYHEDYEAHRLRDAVVLCVLSSVFFPHWVIFRVAKPKRTRRELPVNVPLCTILLHYAENHIKIPQRMRRNTCMRATGSTSCCSFSSPCAESCGEELSNIAHP